MLSPECVRKDLRDIRYYYSRKKELDDVVKELGALPVLRTVERYNCVIELGYTPQYVRKLVNRLNTYFQKNIT